jgi:hypothetical protein
LKGSRVALLVIGILLFLAGAIFTLQGYGIVGPAGGFMYQNKTWVYLGSVILALGLVVAFVAVYVSRIRPKAAPAAKLST